mgnify:CR=1 FL=1
MSKLDELMALADRFALDREDIGGMRARAQSGAWTVLVNQDSRKALQSALKAVVEDAERYQWLRDAHPADDGLWVAMGRPWSPAGVACWREDKLDAAIDAARKPGSSA